MLKKLTVAVILCAVMGPLIASAQAVRSTVYGVVKDASGSVLPGVTITITSTETSAARTATTGASGEYQVQGLTAGKYKLTAELAGFRTVMLQDIELVVGREARFDIALELGQLQETITVTSESPLVETTRSAVGGQVSAEQIRELPLNGRSFTELALLQPGAVNSTTSVRGSGVFGGKGVKIAINGANIWSNQWLLDGTIINDSYNKTPGSIAGVLLGVDTVREFKTYTSSFGAELGGTGGVIDAVTKSGTNAFHGNVFGFVRNSALDARNFFDRGGEPPPFTRYQYGATAGGPLRRERTFFFMGYEHLRERLSQTRLYVVPDEAARRGVLGNPSNPGNPINVTIAPGVAPYLALFPLPDGRNLGDGRAELSQVVSQPTDENYFSLRVDHNFSANDTLFGRFTIDKGEDIVSSPARLATFPESEHSDSRYFTLEEDKIISPRLLNRARLGMTRIELGSDNAPTIDLPESLSFLPGRTFGNASLAIDGLTTLGGNSIQPIQQVQHMLEFSDDVTYTRGRHSMKVGGTYRRYRWDTDQDFLAGGSWTFTGLRGFLTNQGTLLRIKMPGTTTDRFFRQSFFAGFVQDDIQLGSRVTLNAGVRYEYATSPTEKENRLAHLTDELRQTSNDFQVGSFWREHAATKNFGPRLGIAWNVRGDGRTAVRAGAGIYHEAILEDKYDTWRLTSPFFFLGSINSPNFPDPFGQGAAAAVNVRDFIEPIKSPTMYRYSVIVEQQFGRATSASIGYIGAQGRHMWRGGEINTPPPTTLADGRLFFPANTRRINPAFDSVTVRSTDGTSEYNSLQGSVTYRRPSLQGQVSYTLAKSVDDASAIHNNDSLTQQSGLQYYPDRESNRGLSSYDVRHALRANFTYRLPGPSAGAAAQVLGGWEVGGILTLASGSPFSVFAPTLPRGFLFGAQYVNRRPGGPEDPILGGPDRYFDPSAFEVPQVGTLGNLPRNALTGPGLVDVALSLIKNVTFGGGRSMQFRAEAFNAINHANFAPPLGQTFAADGTVRADAGRIRQTVTPARQIQFGLKFNF